ncbi:MAG: CHAT domain-containing protein [Bacteroidetes bacterium]|nr:CHAT domain-containing protein [Bacteroidota bacterium]
MSGTSISARFVLHAVFLLIIVPGCLCLLSACSASTDVAEDQRITEGRLLYDRADFDRAEKHFTAVRETAVQERDTLLEAQAEKWLGSIQLAYERSDAALRHYNRAMTLIGHRIDRHDSLGVSISSEWKEERQHVLSNIAVVHKGAGRFREAEEVLRAVFSNDSARGDDFRAAVTLYNLGDVYHRHAIALLKENDSSASILKRAEARSCFHASLSLFPTADAWLNLGNSHALDNRLDSALHCYYRAEEIYTRDGYRVHRALALGNIGVLAQRLGRVGEAVQALEQSIEIIEELRGDLSSVDIRSSFVSDKFYIYETLIDLLVARNDVGRAFEYVERAKARSFLDLVGSKVIGQGKERPPHIRQLIQREQALQRRIADLVGVSDSSARLTSVIAEHQGVLADLRNADPEYASVSSVEPISADRLRGLLDDSTALLEYFIGESVSFVFLLRRDTMFVRHLPIEGGGAIGQEVEALRRTLYLEYPMRKAGFLREQRLRHDAGSREALRAWYSEVTDDAWQYSLVNMYSMLVAPVAKGLEGITQLYIVPHGPLHHLPFQALVHPRHTDHNTDRHVVRPRYLIEEYAIAYLPSASVLEFALLRARPPVRTGLVIGDPLYADPKYRRRPLHGALIEADTVAGYIEQPLVLKRAEAEEALVTSLMGGHDMLHFATHGELNKNDPMQSRILLAAEEPDSVYNGDLTVAKIFNLDLDAALVTLSACQTAQLAGGDGTFTPGDDLVGLTRSFMYAGTPAVVASLWIVDDDATLAWMRHFYRSRLQEENSSMQAARHAALDMLNHSENPDWVFPYYWAAFIYLGDAR